MTRFIYNTATTLNGFLADESDSLDWLFAVPGAEEAEGGIDEFVEGVGALVMGATTYEWLWRNQESTDPGSWAKSYGTLPCFVVTHRDMPTPQGGDVRFVSGPVPEWAAQVAAAAQHPSRPGEDVWLMGGGDLVGQFDDAGCLDEIRVSVAPVVLERGRPLLPRRIEADRLHLEDVRRVGPFAELVYRVSHPE